jgi:glycogen debranching enzyme
MGAAHRMASPPALTALVDELLGRGQGRGVDTSGGLLFNHTLWARDRVLTALDLLDQTSQPAVETVLALAALQGTRRTVRSEEEPGRIHNEQRSLLGWQAPIWLKALFGLGLASIWGGTPLGYTTYFSSDSTPLFIILVAALAERQPDILHATVVRKDGRVVTVGDSVAEACGWIEGHLDGDGLVSLAQSNILALQQVWKDGPTSNFDEHGRMPNLARPMAYLDVQVLAAEALGRAARLPAGRRQARRPPAARSSEPLSPERLLARSRAIRDATITHFWLPEQRYFAHAIERDAEGRPRPLRALQSNAGWMLATSFFDELPEEQRAALVGGVVRTLFSADMLTVAGIRGRALSQHNPGFRSYHENVWPFDSAIIARGLRHHGLDELADQLEARLLNVANMLGGAFEFVTVDGDGRVVDPRLSAVTAGRLFGRSVPGLPTEMVPDEPQGWTATALLAIKRGGAARARARRPAAPRPAWHADLTGEVLSSIEPVEVCATRAELEERYVPLSPSYLDHGTGLRRSVRTVLVEGFGGVIAHEIAYRAGEGVRRLIDRRGLEPRCGAGGSVGGCRSAGARLRT